MTIEATGQKSGSDERHLNRSIVGEDGETILIEETSGSAYAEAIREPSEAPDEVRPPSRRSNMLLWVGVGLVAGLAARQAWMRLNDRRLRDEEPRGAVAFAAGQSDPENFAQTRNAGPGSMRDTAAQSWDAVDEASDQSFPASDPPGFAP